MSAYNSEPELTYLVALQLDHIAPDRESTFQLKVGQIKERNEDAPAMVRAAVG